MPQMFQVLCCYNCEMFQVHQVKKSNKWQCKGCNSKQSLKKAFKIGSSRDCRYLVQELNMRKSYLPQQQNEGSHNEEFSDSSLNEGCYVSDVFEKFDEDYSDKFTMNCESTSATGLEDDRNLSDFALEFCEDNPTAATIAENFHHKAEKDTATPEIFDTVKQCNGMKDRSINSENPQKSPSEIKAIGLYEKNILSSKKNKGFQLILSAASRLG